MSFTAVVASGENQVQQNLRGGSTGTEHRRGGRRDRRGDRVARIRSDGNGRNSGVSSVASCTSVEPAVEICGSSVAGIRSWIGRSRSSRPW